MPQRPVTDRMAIDTDARADRPRLAEGRIGPPRGTAHPPAHPPAEPRPPEPRPVSPAAPAAERRVSAGRAYNQRLAALIEEAGFSHAGLARRVDQLGLEHGLDLRYDKTSVTRWLRGQQPRGTTPALIAEVFTRRLGRRLTAQDLGLDACAPVYAGLEFAATPEEAVDIVSGLWRKDSGSHAELRKIAFTPAGLVVPSRDWLIGKADDKVAREPAARVPAQGRPAPAKAQGRPALTVPPRARGHAERAPGHKVTGGDISALRSVG